MEYKTGVDSIKSYFLHLEKEKQKIALDESKFAEDFFQIMDCCQSILEFYQKENGEILPLMQKLNLFFKNNEEELQNVDISPITEFYDKIGFNKFIFDIFNGATISADILDALIFHFYILLDFSEFQSFYKLYDNFQCIFNLFSYYQGEEKETVIFCLLKFFNCQNQYESTYSALLSDFSSLSQTILDIEKNPFCNYQLSDLIVSAISSKTSAPFIDQNIISGVISNFPNIIQNLPPFEVDDNTCLFKLYHICKKMIKTDYNILLYLLNETTILETLLSAPLEETNITKKYRIDFLRICLLSRIPKPDRIELLNENRFSFNFAMITEISNYNDVPHDLIESTLKLLSSFIPDFIDELNKKYRPYVIIDIARTALARGLYKEKIEAIELITSIIKIKYIPFIKQLLQIPKAAIDEEENDNESEKNIFCSFNNEMQTDIDEIKIKILSMLNFLCDYLQNFGHQNLRKNFIELLLGSGLQNDIEEETSSSNEEIRNYSTSIMKNIIYYSNLSENSNF